MANIPADTDSVRSYLREIGTKHRLKPEEEIKLGQNIQVWRKLKELRLMMESELGRKTSLDEWANAAELNLVELKQAIERGKLSLYRMVESNLRLVVSVAKQYRSSHMNLMDRVQEGSIGLQIAAERFDPTKGYKFSTYAYWWIRQTITRAMATQERSIRLPIHINEKLSKIRRTRQQLSIELGRIPSLKEIAQKIDMDEQQVRRILEISRQVASLSARAGKDGDLELEGIIEDETINVFETAMSAENQIEVAMFLSYLSPKERDVICLRYGLNGHKEHSLADAAAKLDISRERVRQIERKAMSIMRQQARCQLKP